MAAIGEGGDVRRRGDGRICGGGDPEGWRGSEEVSLSPSHGSDRASDKNAKNYGLGRYTLPVGTFFRPGTVYRRLFCGPGGFAASARVALRSSLMWGYQRLHQLTLVQFMRLSTGCTNCSWVLSNILLHVFHLDQVISLDEVYCGSYHSCLLYTIGHYVHHSCCTIYT